MSIEQILALVSGWLVAAFGWLKWLHELGEKRRERAAKEKAEKELSAIQRRASAPFLQPNRSRFNGIYYDNGEGRIIFISASDSMLLSELRDEVALKPANDPFVIFVVDNSGEPARSVCLKLEGETISLRREAELEHAHGFYLLMYPYQKSKHGVEQRITISFESGSGVQDTHTYLTRHGCRFLKRVDPPLPQ